MVGFGVMRRLALSLSMVFALSWMSASAIAAVPGTLAVEGLLTSTGGGAAADGLYDVTFSIYNVQSGGSAAWTEGETKGAGKNGQFTHILGKAKPLTATLIAKLSQGWLGMKIGTDPELPRQPLHSVTYALLADTASKLACSGCLGAGQLAKGAVGAAAVSFTYAGSKTKGGAATSALDLVCTGCVSVSEMKFDKDVDLGGNALKAKLVSAVTVTAGSFVGDGSKLTGIKIPSGTCKTKGEVVKGINPDGTLNCVKAMDPTAFPADAIDEISNDLIHNQFVDEACGKKDIPIPDNNPTGATDKLVFPDIGLAQKLDVDVELTNSDLKTVTVKIYDPNNVEYVLIDKSETGKTFHGVFPSKNTLVKGDLKTWINKNPKGNWRILVIDDVYLNNKMDGLIKSWCVKIQTLSNKKVQIKGNLIVDGTITGKSDLEVGGDVKVNGGLRLGADTGKCTADKKGTLRWKTGPGLEVCDGLDWHIARSRPVLWSGGCTSHGKGGGWNRYCTNATEFNTAGDYLSLNVGASGIFQAKISGYYRVNMWAISNVCNWAHIRLLVNGITRHYGHEHSQNTWTDNFMDMTWPMKKGDKFEVQFYNSGCSSYAYHSWNANGAHSRLQVSYEGPIGQ